MPKVSKPSSRGKKAESAKPVKQTALPVSTEEAPVHAKPAHATEHAPSSAAKKIDLEESQTFADFGLPPLILQSLSENGFEHPTPIQAHTIPLIQQNKDVLGQAKTGTGKTAAFGIPILAKIHTSGKDPHAIIVVPTRELALQVRDEIENLGKHLNIHIVAVFGGASLNVQANQLRNGAHIVVGTPGRIQDFLRQGILRLNHVQTAVLDEADKMLDMGFKEDIEVILGATPPNRQTLLFSATMPQSIKQLAKTHMKNPVEVNLSADTLTVEGVTQYYLSVDPKQRVTMLLGLVHHFHVTRGIVFCSTKRTVDWLEEQLYKRGLRVAKLHGDMPQNKRQYSLQEFQAGKFPLLLATNVAARGIHIEDISHVINFDFPDEYETYVHRIGRTARQGKKGISITFVTSVSQVQHLRELEQLMNAKIHELKVK